MLHYLRKPFGPPPSRLRHSEGLFDSLLAELAAPTDDSPYLSQLDVAALAAALFEMGAEQRTRARNRQVGLGDGVLRAWAGRRMVDEAGRGGTPAGKEGLQAFDMDGGWPSSTARA